MTYKEQIKHPKWQKKRLEILERDEYICQNCHDDERQLHVHHYYYDKILKLWEYPDDALITFCEDCHNEWHENKKDIDKLFDCGTDCLMEIEDILKMIQYLNPPDLQDISILIHRYLNR